MQPGWSGIWSHSDLLNMSKEYTLNTKNACWTKLQRARHPYLIARWIDFLPLTYWLTGYSVAYRAWGAFVTRTRQGGVDWGPSSRTFTFRGKSEKHCIHLYSNNIYNGFTTSPKTWQPHCRNSPRRLPSDSASYAGVRCCSIAVLCLASHPQAR